MSYAVQIDEDACSADGDCADLAPEMFEVDDFARVIEPVLTGCCSRPLRSAVPRRSGSSIGRPANRSTPGRS